MKDYSNYYETTVHDKIVADGNLIFDAQLIAEGEDVTIDGITYKAIIHESSNPLNLLKEERKIFVKESIDLHRGSVVIHDNITYLVVSEIDTNDVYLRGVMARINLKINMLIEGVACEIPAIASVQTLTIDGKNEVKQVTLPDGQYLLKISNNETTQKITYDNNNRFLIGLHAYKVINIESTIQQGLLAITVERESIDTMVDNQTVAIADYTRHDYDLQVLNDATLTLGLNQTLQINTELKDGDSLISVYTCEYESSDIEVATVSNSGLLSPVATGTAIISITSYGITKTISVTIDANDINNYNLTILGKNYIKIGGIYKYKAQLTLNGTSVSNPNITWTIEYPDIIGLINSIKVEDASTCLINVNKKNLYGTCILKCTDEDNAITSSINLEIISRY